MSKKNDIELLHKKIEKVNTKFAFWSGVVILIGFMLVINIEILLRKFFGIAFGWTTEIGEYLLVLVTLGSGGYCIFGNHHVRVDILYDKFREKNKAMVNIITFACVIILSVILVWKGGATTLRAYLSWECSDSVLSPPLFPFYLLVPIGGLLFGSAAIISLIRTLKKDRKGSDREEM